MMEIGSGQPSRYFRTSWMLDAKTELQLPGYIKIRSLSLGEVEELKTNLQKRNLFARHSWENNFYVQRIAEFANRTVLEVYLQGTPDQISDKAELITDLLETIAIVSTTLAVKKNQLQHRLGIRSKTREEIDFIIGSNFRYIKSRSKPDPDVKGITIDDRFSRRFQNCGFTQLFESIVSSTRRSELVDRLRISIDWLFVSRIEPKLTAAYVKTSIALESLLIFSESESLARSLSERAAFILSSSPDTREKLSKIIKKFYNVRSGIVHGSKRKLRDLNPELLESTDRLCTLLYLVIAANLELWNSTEKMQTWCESQRWGKQAHSIVIPFSDSYLNNAIKLGE